MLIEFIILVSKIIVVMSILLSMVPVLVWVERRGSAFIQDRLGPNLVGPFGLLQPIADVIKLFFKEDPIPLLAHRILFPLAPLFSFIPAAVTFAAIPFGNTIELFGKQIFLQIADINIGILYVTAFGSMGIYGILLAGWASHNKYASLGTLRSAAQMISYEIALGLSLIGPIMIYGTFSLREMVFLQEHVWKWGIFLQPFSFLIFFITAFAECNRLPFDLPEGESELIAGYHTEYGSMKFALFFMSEYLHIVTMSALIVTLFFGGWQLLPGMTVLANTLGIAIYPTSLGLSLFELLSFSLKTAFFAWTFVWVRWTIPRFRYDQLMSFGWKILIPLGLVNIFLTSFMIYFKWV